MDSSDNIVCSLRVIAHDKLSGHHYGNGGASLGEAGRSAQISHSFSTLSEMPKGRKPFSPGPEILEHERMLDELTVPSTGRRDKRWVCAGECRNQNVPR